MPARKLAFVGSKVRLVAALSVAYRRRYVVAFSPHAAPLQGTTYMENKQTPSLKFANLQFCNSAIL